jgi:hypothetical protein
MGGCGGFFGHSKEVNVAYGLLSLLCLITSMTFAEDTTGRALIETFHKNLDSYGVHWKQYSLPGDEIITLYGASRRHYWTPNWFWGEMGSGAISGSRSGYLEGGIMMGADYALTPTFLVTGTGLLGAGGGGSAPQGGGFIIHGSAGLGIKLRPDMVLSASYGYIRFLNGDIRSETVEIQLRWLFWQLRR